MNKSNSKINESDRRPIKSRSWPFFDKLASALANRNVSPNAISVSSILFALIGICLMIASVHIEQPLLTTACLVLAAVMVQLRLISNLLDGMVAERSSSNSPIGRIYNEAPDRVSDILLLLGFGYIANTHLTFAFGAIAACLAVLTAYVRMLAHEVGTAQPFLGPMAKPQRMALLILSLILLAFIPDHLAQQWWGPRQSWGIVEFVLWIIILGCLVTCWRRLGRIMRDTPENQA